MAKKPKYTIQLNLNPSSIDHLNEIAKRTGLSKTTITERVFDWLTTQDELVQLRVLGVLSDELAGRLGELVVKEMASNAPPSASERQAS